MQIIIPAAGAGKRFKEAGYIKPKPLIDVFGKPMLQRVIENLGVYDRNGELNRFTILLNKSDYDEYFNEFTKTFNELESWIHVIEVNGLTEGAASTCLLAENKIEKFEPVVIANCDQIVYPRFLTTIIDDIEESLYSPIEPTTDIYPTGVIVTFKSNETKHSYVKLTNFNGMEYINEVAEKKVISDNATVGVYAWKFAEDLFSSIDKMISRNIRTNNEFYLAPSYNILIEEGQLIVPLEIKKPWPIGTPEDLQKYIKHVESY